MYPIVDVLRLIVFRQEEIQMDENTMTVILVVAFLVFLGFVIWRKTR